MAKIKVTLRLTALFCIVLLSSMFPIAYGFSQNYELNQGVYSGLCSFNLKVGDQVEGSISVSNLGPYPLGPLALALNESGTSYEVVDIWVILPSGTVPYGNNLEF